mgnify:CR=1 FL=1
MIICTISSTLIIPSEFKSTVALYSEFITNKNQSESMVASTILKIQEKKTQKGTSYAIIKFSDLGGVFELFVFSDLFELNRDNIKIILTPSKTLPKAVKIALTIR